jgi:HD-GYP domain-containing protein (c-di-GMP phosphodiesterase class II)
MVRHHHERYDGRGYPDGLSREQIPLGARILAVADAYDAMTSERPYRAAMSVETACAEIQRCKGSQFDAEVAEAFLRTQAVTSSVV